MLKMPKTDHILTEWKDIEYFDIPNGKKKVVITKDEFEQMVGDTFEAVQVDSYGDAEVIWTTKYVFKVRAIKLDSTTNILTGYLRNWKS